MPSLSGRVRPLPDRPSWSAPYGSSAISRLISNGSRATLLPSPERVFLALGSNLGDRAEHLRVARQALDSLPGTTLLAASVIEETPPLGGMQQPPYLNQMVLVETQLTPRELLVA